MKNLIILLFLIVFSIIQVQATNWIEIDNKMYMDVDSVEPFVSDRPYNTRNNQYSFWIKSLNDGSDSYKQLEKHFNKRVWYSLSKYVVDLNTQKIAQKTSVLYAVNEKQPLDSYEEQFDSLLQWQTIVPNSVGELMFNIVQEITKRK